MYSEENNVIMKPDYTDFIAGAKKNLEQNEEAITYLRSLGLMDETIMRCNLGFNEGNIVIPYNGANSYYMEYSMNNDSSERIMMSPEDDNQQGVDTFYNAGVLKNGNVIFVVESAICALSVFQSGGRAVAINKAENAKALIDAISKMPDGFQGVFVVSLNNNQTGKVDKMLLKEYFIKEHIPYIDTNLAGEFLTPNDMLQDNKEAFVKSIAQLKKRAQSMLEIHNKADNIQSYLETKLNSDMELFINNKTKVSGYAELDQLSGGLQAGLYVLGGLSASGKTTFLNQMADQIAQMGEQVLYFSMEQSVLELVSKSVAREAYLSGTDANLTSTQLRAGESDDFNTYATRYYNKVKTNLSIIECEADYSLDDLETYISKFINSTKQRPVVMIDYLQAFVVDAVALRRIARMYRVPVIAVYCIPRLNYLKPISLERFAEVEYSADVIWGLQLKMLTEDIYEKEDIENKQREMLDLEMRKNPRRLQLICLKNRYGAKYSVEYEYYTQNDYFKEASAQIEELTEATGGGASYKSSQIPDWVLEGYKKSLNIE